MSTLTNSYYQITSGRYKNKYDIYGEPGTIRWLMRGLLFNASINTPQTVWNQGGDYTYLGADTPLYISSTSASDTDVDIRVTGLDENLNLISFTETLNGQTQVLLGSMYRVHDMVTSRGTLVGVVYLAESDTLTGGVPDTTSKIQSKIGNEGTPGEAGEYLSDHSAHSGFFTVPAKYELHLFQVLGTSEGSEGSLTYRLKLPGGPWLNRNPLAITGNRIEEIFNPPIILPTGTEIQARALGSNGKRVSTRAQGWLIPTQI